MGKREWRISHSEQANSEQRVSPLPHSLFAIRYSRFTLFHGRTICLPAIPHLRLGVNIDHVATLRNARGGVHPDPVKAAHLAIAAGADGITAHLREDRRHIRDDDIARLKADLARPLNLEMAATEEMLAIALKTIPHAVCLVPERRQERTT